jgi:hypothetical protein
MGKIQKEENFETLFLVFRQSFSCPVPRYFKKNLLKAILGYKSKNFHFHWIFEKVKNFFYKKKNFSRGNIGKKKKKNKFLKTIKNNYESKNEYNRDKFYPMWRISDMRKENLWNDSNFLKKKKRIKKINFFYNSSFFRGKTSFFSNIYFLLNKTANQLNFTKRLIIVSLTSTLKFL